MLSRFALAMIAAAATTATAGTTTLILDDFDADPNDAAGGPRTLATAIVNNPFNQAASFAVDTNLGIGADTGALLFNSGIGVEQEAVIIWDNNGAGLGLDAVTLGLTGFELDLAAVDLDFTYFFRLTDGDGGTATASGTIAAGIERTESWDLSDFSGAFDASDVSSISFVFNVQGTTASLDFIATEFRAVVPSPGTVALIGVGGLVAIRRRR